MPSILRTEAIGVPTPKGEVKAAVVHGLSFDVFRDQSTGVVQNYLTVFDSGNLFGFAVELNADDLRDFASAFLTRLAEVEAIGTVQ